jgi:hypothetical protein
MNTVLKKIVLVCAFVLGFSGTAWSSEAKIWSILICTLPERKESFDCLCKKLNKQIRDHKLQNKVEILSFLDNRGEHTVGQKRNALLRKSAGKYTCFVDDDDDVNDDYIIMIYEKLLKDPDCVSLTGIITANGRNPQLFIHSIRYTTWFEENKIYYRPPNHLNPIRRSIAIQFSFPEINRSEDFGWSMQIQRSNLIKTEEFIDEPYYFYNYQGEL